MSGNLLAIIGFVCPFGPFSVVLLTLGGIRFGCIAAIQQRLETSVEVVGATDETRRGC